MQLGQARAGTAARGLGETIGILPDGRLWPELSTTQTKDLHKWQGDSHAGEQCSHSAGWCIVVLDAEEVGVMLSWEHSNIVALDSQGVIQRIANLRYNEPRSWIEEKLVRQMQARPRTLMWVRGHTGVQGNEEADKRAKAEVAAGEWQNAAGIATPRGIKQDFPLYPKASAHISWTAAALRGLVYMVTDKPTTSVVSGDWKSRHTVVCMR